MSPYDGSAETGGEPERRGAAPCPVCAGPMAVEHRPFCSARCREIDLHRWLAGVYRVPSEEPPEAGEAGEAPPPARDEK
jgi:hypothetical protein